MAAGVWFWVIYVIFFLLGFVFYRDDFAARRYGPVGSYAVVFILLGLLGLAVFGAPLK